MAQNSRKGAGTDEQKKKNFDILGMILGVLLAIVNGMMVGLEYMYQVGDKIYMLGTMRDKMIPTCIWCVLLSAWCVPDLQRARDFRRYRRYQLFKSICAGREYVEIEEIARKDDVLQVLRFEARNRC